MFALVTKLLTTRLGLATLAGSGAAGVAYTTSRAARAEDLKDGVKDGAYFADTAENTINKAVGGVVALGGHVLSAATGETAQAGIRTAHDLTTKTLVGAREAAPAVGSAAYNAAAFTAETGISVAHAGYGGIYNFISEHILPKDASGWLKTLAAASVVGLGGAWVASSGKLGGVAQKLGEFIFTQEFAVAYFRFAEITQYIYPIYLHHIVDGRVGFAIEGHCFLKYNGLSSMGAPFLQYKLIHAEIGAFYIRKVVW
jgi:hypothetical protein